MNRPTALSEPLKSATASTDGEGAAGLAAGAAVAAVASVESARPSRSDRADAMEQFPFPFVTGPRFIRPLLGRATLRESLHRIPARGVPRYPTGVGLKLPPEDGTGR